jgi:hypothetical protein
MDQRRVAAALKTWARSVEDNDALLRSPVPPLRHIEALVWKYTYGAEFGAYAALSGK